MATDRPPMPEVEERRYGSDGLCSNGGREEDDVLKEGRLPAVRGGESADAPCISDERCAAVVLLDDC